MGVNASLTTSVRRSGDGGTFLCPPSTRLCCSSSCYECDLDRDRGWALHSLCYEFLHEQHHSSSMRALLSIEALAWSICSSRSESALQSQHEKAVRSRHTFVTNFVTQVQVLNLGFALDLPQLGHLPSELIKMVADLAWPCSLQSVVVNIAEVRPIARLQDTNYQRQTYDLTHGFDLQQPVLSGGTTYYREVSGPSSQSSAKSDYVAVVSDGIGLIAVVNRPSELAAWRKPGHWHKSIPAQRMGSQTPLVIRKKVSVTVLTIRRRY